jgi:phosphohistidine phosphatase SixA
MKQKTLRAIGRIFICLLLVSETACTTTIYLVRHAEKLNSSTDTPLSPMGEQRASALRDSLINKGIDLVYVSTFLRTQQTARPLCTSLNKNFIVYAKDTSALLARHLMQIRRKDILVVGHTDNLPVMVEEITGQDVTIPDDVFNKLFIIRIKRFLSTKLHLQETTFGN